jgi:SSS family transporter
VVSIVLGTGNVMSILVIVCLTIFYTFEGGMTAVIWTDVVQMFLYVGGAILSFYVILGEIPGGWDQVAAVAGPLGKFQVLDFGFEPSMAFFSKTYNFWAGIIGGCFLTTASHGTEQLMVQRLLAARSERDARRALFASWAVIFFQFTLFLLIGAMLFVYYREHNLPPPAHPDRIYPGFVWNELPVGIAGLVTAAILAAAMSNLSAALNSLASTTVMDFLKPVAELRGQMRADSAWLAIARRTTLVWGAVLFAIAVVAQNVKSVLEAGLAIASVVYGALLGVFLLGVLTKRVGERSAMCGMLAGFLVMLYVRLGTPIAWTWYVAIGTSATFFTALAVSFIIREEQHG